MPRGIGFAALAGMAEPDAEKTWRCLRCLWIFTGREGDEIAEHSESCPFRATGRDPDPHDVEVTSDGPA